MEPARDSMKGIHLWVFYKPTEYKLRGDPVNSRQHPEDYERDLYQVFLIQFHFPHPKAEVGQENLLLLHN